MTIPDPTKAILSKPPVPIAQPKRETLRYEILGLLDQLKQQAKRAEARTLDIRLLPPLLAELAAHSESNWFSNPFNAAS